MERYGKDDVENMIMIAGTKHGAFFSVIVSSKQNGFSWTHT